MAKEKVLLYANKISNIKPTAKNALTVNDPEYKILEPVVSEEMAEAALCLNFREPMLSAADIAPKINKTTEETEKLLWELADCGAAFVKDVDGVNKYWHEIWVPGHMEMMVNHRENVKKYPIIAECFDAYGKKKGPFGAGKIPMGIGPMRVIPIETAISGETRSAPYEEIARYLNGAERFSVSDCSCRTSREAMGEGCGHLKEDMCIQLDHAAEYYIRTGRGREITREEAFEIIHRAEENGLMHQIPNLDGSGKTHAICNCCGCSCFSLRLANMWTNPDMIRSNYVAQVNKDNCVACGECVENCPTNAVRLGHKLCTTTPVVEKKRDLPYDTEWGEDKWNPEYRLNKQVIVETGTSPCKSECPAHIGIQGYIKLASQGRYTEALELIKHENPFPAVCGRICPRGCESACTRGDIDDPIAIDDIKKFIAEQDLNKDVRFIPKKRHDYGKEIAIIGAGPAGLSCAYYLAIDGYKVTVFEKQNKLGGMLTLGIPEFRLEKDVINAEIDILRELGVEFKTGVEVGKDVTLKELREQGFKAFYIAIGAQAGRKLGLEGEDAQGVFAGVDFLRSVNLGEEIKLSGNVVVIGGGNVAIDVARVATRVGSETVNLFCLESREQMPALDEEIEEAEEENIIINNSWGPKRIVTENGRVVGVEFVKCVSVFDEDGKFNPKYDEAQTKIVDADHVLLSVGQAMDFGNLLADSKVEFNPNKTIKADAVTYQTAEPDVFVGGDVYTGPRFAIDAIAAGKEGAISIHRFVQPGQSLVIGRLDRNYCAFDKNTLNLDGFDNMPRQRAVVKHDESSKKSFKDIRGILTEEQIKKETERCIGCGAAIVDEFMCVGCGQCTTKCKFDAISLVRKYDCASVDDFSELKPKIVKYNIKRKGKIVAKNIKNVFTKK